MTATTQTVLIISALIGYVVALVGYGLLRLDISPLAGYVTMLVGGTAMGAGMWAMIQEARRNGRS